jgi:hypothetical protein
VLLTATSDIGKNSSIEKKKVSFQYIASFSKRDLRDTTRKRENTK